MSGEAPALRVPVLEGLGVGKGLGEGDYGGLSVDGASELLSVGKDDCEVDALENTVEISEDSIA